MQNPGGLIWPTRICFKYERIFSESSSDYADGRDPAPGDLHGASRRPMGQRETDLISPAGYVVGRRKGWALLSSFSQPH